MGFFQKKPSNTPTRTVHGLPAASGSVTRGTSSSLTPAPSSDPPEETETFRKAPGHLNGDASTNGLPPSPITPATAAVIGKDTVANGSVHFSSPSRKVRCFPLV